MSAYQQYNFSPCLTPVRLVATSNVAGTYFNGQTNNGVGATLTCTAGVLTIDSVTVNAGDRVLLQAQSSNLQNGIYLCTVAGASGVSAILQRAEDMQSIEQLVHGGLYVSVFAGTVNAGAIYVYVDPKPIALGTNGGILFDSVDVSAGLGTAAAKAASNNADATLASVTGSYVIGDLATYADTSGSLADSGLLATNIVLKNAVNTMAAASEIILDKGTGTESTHAVTVNHQSGVITTSSLSTAGGGSYLVTMTNSFAASSSVVLVSSNGGTNTTENYSIVAVPSAGAVAFTIYNNTAATALNGTIIFSFAIF